MRFTLQYLFLAFLTVFIANPVFAGQTLSPDGNLFDAGFIHFRPEGATTKYRFDYVAPPNPTTKGGVRFYNSNDFGSVPGALFDIQGTLNIRDGIFGLGASLIKYDPTDSKLKISTNGGTDFTAIGGAGGGAASGGGWRLETFAPQPQPSAITTATTSNPHRVGINVPSTYGSLSTFTVRGAAPFTGTGSIGFDASDSKHLFGGGGSKFLAEVRVGDKITVPGQFSGTQERIVTQVVSDNSLFVDQVVVPFNAGSFTIHPAILRVETFNGNMAALTIGADGVVRLTSDWQRSSLNDMYYLKGNIAVGVDALTTPIAALLHVATTAPKAIFRADDDGPGDTSPFIIDASGNVGIGVVNPTVKLQVANGSLAVDNDSVFFSKLGVGLRSPIIDSTANLMVQGNFPIQVNGATGGVIHFPALGGTITADVSGASTQFEIGDSVKFVDKTDSTRYLVGDIAELSGDIISGLTNTSGSLSGTLNTDLPVFVYKDSNLFQVRAGSGGDLSSRLTIDKSGNVGIGTTGPGAKLDVNGDAIFNGLIIANGDITGSNLTITGDTTIAGNTTFEGQVIANGGITGSNLTITGNTTINGSATITGNISASAFFYNSDRSLKENIERLSSSLEKINQLEGVRFSWKKDGEKSIGLIAQDVEKVFPEIVYTNEETGLKAVDYGKLVAPLIEAVKEQQAEIEELRGTIQQLQEKVR